MSRPKHDNIDYQEVEKFEQEALHWWDLKGKHKPLHDINPLRQDYINRHISISGKSVLDVGCGGGILSESMSRHNAKVTAIDIGRKPLEIAKLHALKLGYSIKYYQITVEELAYKYQASFDVVTCMEMLEHVPKPSSVVNACAQLVKPGGYLFFSTINRNFKAWIFMIVGAEYLFQILPKGTHDYTKFIRPSELSRWLHRTGLELINITGITYNPFKQTYGLDTKDIDVNYLLTAVKR